MKTDKLLKLLPAVLLWAPVIFFSGLLIHNSLLYFSFDQTYGILPEKTEQINNNPLWLTSFYVHVLSGIVCLIIPPFSFIGVQLKKSVKFHRITGQIYTWNMLAVLAPTGIYMGFYAKGGISSQVGFILQGILVFIFTWFGYKTASTSIGQHRDWMIRSFTIVSSVITFRILHLAFMFINLSYEDIYGLSQWVSLTGHIFLGEAVILLKQKKSSVTFNHKFITT